MSRQKLEDIKSQYDGLKLSLLTVTPKEGKELHGVIQLVHGMCEYKERYLPFMKFMAKHGYICVIHDNRGHGKSVKNVEDLGYMYRGKARAFVEDIHQITLLIRERYPRLPVILFGHSMGSLAVRAYLKKYDSLIDMLIVCGSPSKNPGVILGRMIAVVQGKLQGERHRSKLLEALSFGSFAARFPKEMRKHAWICTDQLVVKEYEDSRLCGFTFTVDGYRTLFQLMEEAYSGHGWQCTKPRLPILFLGGAQDPCIGNPRKFAAAIRQLRSQGYQNVRGKLYPGLRHEILNEPCKKEIYKDIAVYIRRQEQEIWPVRDGQE